MKRILTLAILCLSAVLVFGQHGGSVSTSAETKSEIHWLTFEEAFAKHQEEPKKWLIDVSTVWCGWCKRMDATTFADSLVIDHVTGNFYAVALDGEYKDPITVGDRTYEFVPEGRRGYHQLPAELMGGNMTYPTVVFLGEGLENLSAVPGYHAAPEFLKIVEFFKAYDKDENPITWTEFVESYVSPYPEVEQETTPN